MLYLLVIGEDVNRCELRKGTEQERGQLAQRPVLHTHPRAVHVWPLLGVHRRKNPH